MPDWKERGTPIENPVEEDHVLFLTKNRKFELPIVPPPLQNHGNYIISLNKFTRWFGEQVEASGADIFTGFAGADLLIEGDALVGIRTGDQGVDKTGKPKGNFGQASTSPKLTILAGPRSSLTKQLIRKFDLDRGRNPQVLLGVKEVWDVPENLAAGSFTRWLASP
jgi:electron-transferring-flavoprotein dehydrogenase